MSARIKKSDSIFTVGFVVVLIINIFSGIKFHGVRSVIANYTIDMGLSDSLAGLVAGALSVSAFLTRPFSGKLASGSSRLLILRLVFAAEMVITLLYLLCGSFIPLVLVRFCDGFVYAMSTTILMTVASLSLPQNKIGSGIGLFGMGNILSLALGPSIMVALYGFGAVPLFVGCAISVVLAFMLTFLIPRASGGREADEDQKDEKTSVGLKASGEKPAKGWRSFLAPEALMPATMLLLGQFSNSAIGTFIAYYVTSVKGFGGVGFFFIIWSLSLVVGRPFVGSLYDKKGLTPIIFVTMPMLFVSMLFISFATGMWMIYVASFLGAIGFGGSIAAYQAHAVASAAPERRGLASSTYFMGSDIGAFVGPSVAGITASAFGYENMYILFTFPIIASVIFYVGYIAYKNKRNAGIVKN